MQISGSPRDSAQRGLRSSNGETLLKPVVIVATGGLITSTLHLAFVALMFALSTRIKLPKFATLRHKIKKNLVANTKSAYKRIEIAERNRLRNKAYKSTVKTLIKKTLISISTLNKENLASVLSLMALTYSKIDKAVQKGVLHSNNGNSKKSSLSKAFKKYELALQK